MASYDIREMSFGEIIDGAFAIYRRNFALLVGIAVVTTGIPTILNVYVTAVGLAFVNPFIVLVSAVPILIGGVVVAVGGASVLGGLIAFGAVVLGLVAFLVVQSGYAVVTQAVVLEDETSATGALGRSWALTKGFKKKALGLIVVLWVLLVVPSMAAAVLGALAPALEVVIAAAGGFLQLIIYPIFACTFTLLYYDLRVRHEAFDIEHLGQQLGLDSFGE